MGIILGCNPTFLIQFNLMLNNLDGQGKVIIPSELRLKNIFFSSTPTFRYGTPTFHKPVNFY